MGENGRFERGTESCDKAGGAGLGTGRARGLRKRLTRRGLRDASVPDILEWLGRQKTEEGSSRKEILSHRIWEHALAAEVPMIRLLIEYLAGKPMARPVGQAGEQLPLFSADQMAEATRGLGED